MKIENLRKAVIELDLYFRDEISLCENIPDPLIKNISFWLSDLKGTVSTLERLNKQVDIYKNENSKINNR